MSSMQRSKMLCLQSDVPPLCSPSCVSCLPQGFALVHSRGARTCWSPGKVFESTGAVEDTECTANSTGECCLLKVVQPLVWRLLGLHKIQMQVEVNKRKVCHVMISTLGGYGWSQLDGWIDQSYIQYHAWSLRWLIHHIVKYFHTHIRFLELFGLFGGFGWADADPSWNVSIPPISSLYIALSMSIQQSQSMNLDLKHALDYRLDMTRLFNMSGW